MLEWAKNFCSYNTAWYSSTLSIDKHEPIQSLLSNLYVFIPSDQNRINDLNNEASGLRERIQSLEENRANLANNRQFGQAHEKYEDQIVMLE